MSADNRQIKLAVSGMSCTGCSSRVQKALENVKGVESAHVDLDGASAIIAIDANGPTADELAAVVTNIGYDATPSEE